jgi:hypothetical protein
MKYTKAKIKRWFLEARGRNRFPIPFFSKEDVCNYIDCLVKAHVGDKTKVGFLTSITLVKDIKGDLIEIIVSVDYKHRVSYKNCHPY